MAGVPLFVVYGRVLVGRLATDDLGRLAFTYDVEWLGRGDRFPISASLPLAETAYREAGHAFFANLLPEGAAREAICARLGISRENDAALLRAIGGECAGALSVVESPDATASDEEPTYDQLDDRRLQALVDRKRVVPLLAAGAKTRMSLAGAQDKLPVAVLEGQLHLPRHDAPSTHILKLPHSEYAHVPANEAFVLALARALSFDVPDAELLERTDPPSLLVARHDRAPSDDPWPVVRLHQEDLCQALGLPPSRKYEQEGGPSLRAVVELLREQVQEPAIDVRRVIEWQAFNVCAGNSDGHGKNLSILYAPGAPRLAPFYDLLATRQYPRLDRRLAMSVGGERDADRLGRRHWETLAADTGLAPRIVVSLASAVAERCGDAVSSVVADFRGRYGKQPILQTLPRAIVRRARKLQRSLAAG